MEGTNCNKIPQHKLVIRLTIFKKRKSGNLIIRLTKFYKKKSWPTRVKRTESLKEIYDLVETGKKMFSLCDFESAKFFFANACDITDNWKRASNILRTHIHMWYADAIVACGEIFTPLQMFNIGSLYVGPIKYKRLKHYTKHLMILCKPDKPYKYNDPFLCAICQDIPNEPATIRCGHTFCRQCINRTHQCRVCGYLHPDMVKQDIMVNHLIDKAAPELSKLRPIRTKISEHLRKSKILSAYQACNYALNISNRDHIILNQRSEVFYELKDYQKSLEDAEMVTKLHPTYYRGYWRQALALEKLGRIEDAIFAYCLFRHYNHGKLDPSFKSKITSLLCQMLSEYNPDIYTKLQEIREKLDTIFEYKNHLTKILKPDNISINDFECPICYDIINQPISLPCGHSLCSNCLKETIHRKICPYCQVELPQNFLNNFTRYSTERSTIYIEEALKKWFPSFAVARFPPTEKILMLNITSELSISEKPLDNIQNAINAYHENSFKLGILFMSPSDSKSYRYGCVHEVTKDGETNKILPRINARFRVKMDQVPSTSDLLTFQAEAEYITDYLAEDSELIELKILHDNIRNKAMKWFNSLSTSEIYFTIKVFGEIPDVEENWHTLPNGPAWVWWIMTIKSTKDIWLSRMIGSQNLEERLDWIEKSIQKYQQQCASNEILVGVIFLFLSWNTKTTCDALSFLYMLLAYCLHLLEFGSNRRIDRKLPFDYFNLFQWIFERQPWRK